MARQRVSVAELRAWIRQLRELCPPLLPVVVVRKSDITHCGSTAVCYVDGHPSHFEIVLRSGQTLQETFDSLLHEWAHCLAWTEGHNTTCDHDALWGAAMSIVYSEMVQP